MKKNQLAAIAVCSWLIIITLFMFLSLHVDIEVFFVLWLIGILVITELTDTGYSRTIYRSRITYVIATGIFLFGIIVIKKVLVILNS